MYYKKCCDSFVFSLEMRKILKEAFSETGEKAPTLGRIGDHAQVWNPLRFLKKYFFSTYSKVTIIEN